MNTLGWVLLAACVVLVLLPPKWDPAIRLKERFQSGYKPQYDKRYPGARIPDPFVARKCSKCRVSAPPGEQCFRYWECSSCYAWNLFDPRYYP